VPDYIPLFYDPLGTENVTSAICSQLEHQPFIPLEPEIERFEGSGLYAIYYKGTTLPLYAPLANYEIPVYAGQSLSHNSRTGAAAAGSCRLYERIRDHRNSIAGAGLPLLEFGVRLLRLPDVHADLGENGLRVFYQPVWNKILDGFGGHEQGSTTRQSKRTRWDTIHSGRNRTYGADTHNPAELRRKVAAHIAWQIERYNEAPWHQG
jgi:hypothetical protein